ncbi:hypothetical protein J7I98_28655 [Streptomyces sp. ISL-98]|uniref:hypothetical protein n=1 Tax=Streptomyces sp. ISL-98 TaxID=2819192 RepID=UPI001BEB6444|nr:hypothetical protein [Streptomyces sp. ISL-98]MBT2509773.1 hypothetical protein [Streptomyces sp. ISL-98]
MSTSVVRAGAGPRLLRTAVFTAVCVALSATGHVMASCATVPWWTIALGCAAVFAVVAPLAGRARSLPAIATALTCGQLALHVLFGLGQHNPALQSAATDTSLRMLAAKLLCGAGALPLSTAEARRIVTEAGIDPASVQAAQQHLTHAAHASHTANAAQQSEAVANAGLFPTLPMLLGHMLAAVAAGWLLRRGEAALTRLVLLSAHGVAEGALVRSLRAALALVRSLRAGLPGAPAQRRRALRTPFLAPLRPPGEALQHTVIRRGPPSAALVLAA